MCVFTGSGVGKSFLTSMLTKYAATDVKVIGLIGERGRKTKELIEEYLGPEGLKKVVVVMATGDKSVFLRKRVAYMIMTVFSEFFPYQGREYHI